MGDKIQEKKLTQEEEQARNQEYNDYVEQITPKHNLWANMGKAFLLGGFICVIGQGIINLGTNRFGLEKEDAMMWCSLILVLISVILTSLNAYSPLAVWGGAGALVPITGFANGVASSAIEFQKEGQVFGIGCQIFRIAGPVILYGIFSSWVLGLLYWLGKLAGLFA